MSTLNNIQNALATKLNSLLGLPTIYWPNTPNEPSENTPWIRPTLLPAEGSLYTVNDGNQHIGIYQIDIFTRLKKGTSEALLYADVVRDGFNKQRLTNNGTTVFVQNISMSSAERTESWWRISININYICIA